MSTTLTSSPDTVYVAFDNSTPLAPSTHMHITSGAFMSCMYNLEKFVLYVLPVPIAVIYAAYACLSA